MAVVNIEKDLSSPDKQRRMLALLYIWINRDARYLSPVKDLLVRDPDQEVRARCAWVLDHLRDITAADALLEALSDGDWGVRSNAGWGLVHLGPEISERVTSVLRESHSDEAREMAALVLQRL